MIFLRWTIRIKIKIAVRIKINLWDLKESDIKSDQNIRRKIKLV